MNVLALDLASVTGWACGEPGGVPFHGTQRFASAGASHEAIFAGAYAWMKAKCFCYQPTTVVWEAPLSGTIRFGSTTSNTTAILHGLPAVIGAVAFQQGIYDIRKAETRDVRLHFIGSNPKRAIAKATTMRQCRAMGWQVDDDNEADALATWSYMCSLIDPKLAIKPMPLFGRGTSRVTR